MLLLKVTKKQGKDIKMERIQELAGESMVDAATGEEVTEPMREG